MSAYVPRGMPCSVTGCQNPALTRHSVGCGRGLCAPHVPEDWGSCPVCGDPLQIPHGPSRDHHGIRLTALLDRSGR